MLNTGERVTVSNLLICGYTSLNTINRLMKMMTQGIMIIVHGQFTTAIEIIIPKIVSPVCRDWSANL